MAEAGSRKTARRGATREHMIHVLAQHAAWAKGVCACNLCERVERAGLVPVPEPRKSRKRRAPASKVDPAQSSETRVSDSRGAVSEAARTLPPPPPLVDIPPWEG